MAISESLTEKLKKCNSESELLDTLNSCGYQFSSQQLQSIQSPSGSTRELSDDELNAVTGGSVAGDIVKEVFDILLNLGKENLFNKDSNKESNQ